MSASVGCAGCSALQRCFYAPDRTSRYERGPVRHHILSARWPRMSAAVGCAVGSALQRCFLA